MWLPTRITTAPNQIANGYSINKSTGARFPSGSGFVLYPYGGYTSFYEALYTLGEDENVSVFDLDFNKKSGTFGKFNPCKHYKRECLVHPTLCSNTYTALAGGYTNYNIPISEGWKGNNLNPSPAPYLVFGSSDNPIAGLPVLWAGLEGGPYASFPSGSLTAALNAMLPGIRPQASLINSIYELKDMKTLPKSWKHLNDALDSLNFLLKSKPHKPYWTLRRILKGPADVNLQNKFNVRPLLQDIVTVSNAVNNVRNKLKQLKAESSKPQSRHWGCSLGLRDSDDSYACSYTQVQNPSVGSIRRVVNYATQRFTATIEYSYELPDGSDEELLYRGLTDYLGLNLSIQTIWNAIPWSFVVDWVVGIGPWLGQFTQRQLEVVTHIRSFGWSVKVDRTINTYLEPFGAVTRLREVSYVREPSGVPLVDSLRVSGINSSEFKLAGSLVLTR